MRVCFQLRYSRRGGCAGLRWTYGGPKVDTGHTTTQVLITRPHRPHRPRVPRGPATLVVGHNVGKKWGSFVSLCRNKIFTADLIEVSVHTQRYFPSSQGLHRCLRKLTVTLPSSLI